jgi:CDP-diacylglycerol--glycerol-3-phosphate 3-phosphatidyltransferase
VINVLGRAGLNRALAPIGAWLAARGVSADVVTVVGTMGVSGGAIGFLPRGHFVVGVLVVTAFVFSDMLDGAVSRASGTSGPWGAFLDSSLDRVGDAAVFGSLVWWYAFGGDSRPVAFAALLCLTAGSVTSYVKARAESLGLSCNVGIAERAERLILVLVACFFDQLLDLRWLLPSALWLLAGLSLVTVGQRFATVWRQTRHSQHAGQPGA